MPIRKRRLGRTNLEIAELGLGAMDTPTSPDGFATVTAALDLGIDFVDTARDYGGSEFLLANVIRSRGGKAFAISSKTFKRTSDGAQWDVDRSLKVLGVDFIDVYHLHDVRTYEDWAQVKGTNGALAGLKTAQYRGLIGHIALSTHELEIGREAIVSGGFGAVMLEYSAFYTASAPLLELAADRDVGVIVMRPLGGSGRTSVMRTRLERGDAGVLTPQNLLRYVLSNSAVSVAIPGARFPDRVRDNVATALTAEPMAGDEMGALESAAAALY
jgi:aryl-alcohol dehydrogenase-like predicted oxidoreductase